MLITDSKPWLDNYKLDFSRLLRDSRLPHALLIAAPQGSGKQLLASWLGQTLLCQNRQATKAGFHPCGTCKSCQLQAANTHPDRLDIRPEKSTLGVDAIREVSSYLQTRPQLSHSKYVVIENAEKLTESAANALLKTLEEPNKGNFIVLLCEHPEDVLATIISRCRLVSIAVPAGEKLLAGLEQSSFLEVNGSSEKLRHSFLNVSHLSELLNPELELSKIEVWQSFLQFVEYSDNHQLLVQLLVEHEHSIKWLSELLQLWLRDQAGWQLNLSGSEDLVERFTRLGHLYDNAQHWQCLTLIKAFLHKVKSLQQFNLRMSAEQLLLEIEKIYHPQESL